MNGSNNDVEGPPRDVLLRLAGASSQEEEEGGGVTKAKKEALVNPKP